MIAQDPTITRDGAIITDTVDVPDETIEDGPRGHRVNVVDYDATRKRFYPDVDFAPGKDYWNPKVDPRANRAFHAQNVYAIVMRTLFQFEYALGRRVRWSFAGHQLQVAPHGLNDANAFYSERDHALIFGYFVGASKRTVFNCLSYDVVAHEATHALLDGLRNRYTDPSLLDQAAFHEGFADIVALLSTFSLRNLVKAVVESSEAMKEGAKPQAGWLKRSALLGLAEEFGTEISEGSARRDALRRFGDLDKPNPKVFEGAEFREPHRRGEVLVAGVMEAFTRAWEARLGQLDWADLPVDRYFEEGAKVAEHLLVVAVRALDYCPPVDLEFGDYLSAILTADRELAPTDLPFRYRKLLLDSFGAWGIGPGSKGPQGEWKPPAKPLDYSGIHFESLQNSVDEVFRFIWQNADELHVFRDAFTWVNWVRPVVRVAPDGFILHETVAEYIQQLDVPARRLGEFDIEVPDEVPRNAQMRLQGGGTLIFDEFGDLKYEVHKDIRTPQRQSKKIKRWWREGITGAGNLMGFAFRDSPMNQFALWHRLRMASVRRADGRKSR